MSSFSFIASENQTSEERETSASLASHLAPSVLLRVRAPHAQAAQLTQKRSMRQHTLQAGLCRTTSSRALNRASPGIVMGFRIGKPN